MNLTTVQKQIEQLPEEAKNAILALIDLKTENDMKEVILRLDNLKEDFQTFKGSVSFKFNVIIWFLGVVMTIALAIAGFTIFK